jgi:hypothetical protein
MKGCTVCTFESEETLVYLERGVEGSELGERERGVSWEREREGGGREG